MNPGDLATCARCGIRRYVKHERGGGLCRDCPPEKPWDEAVPVTDVRWVRRGLVWRPSVDSPVDESRSEQGESRDLWDNGPTRKDGPGRCANTVIPRALPTNKESTNAR